MKNNTDKILKDSKKYNPFYGINITEKDINMILEMDEKRMWKNAKKMFMEIKKIYHSKRNKTLKLLNKYKLYFAQGMALTYHFNNIDEFVLGFDKIKKDFEYNFKNDNLHFGLLTEKDLKEQGFSSWKQCIGHLIPMWIYLLLPDDALLINVGCADKKYNTEEELLKNIVKKKDIPKEKIYHRFGFANALLVYKNTII